MLSTIYTDTIGYPEKRNIVDLPHKQYTVEKRFNAFRIPNALYFKYYDASNSFFLNSHFEPLKKRNIHHFFNTISFGNAPWITTFETLLPRWGNVPKWLEKKGVGLLAGKNCKKLIAISSCTKNLQAHYLDAYPEFKDLIIDKTIVLHPPQKLLINSIADKRIDRNLIVFTFVGADFFRKGGKEILLVFERLLNENAPIKLNIVSTLQYGDYASKSSVQDKEQAYKIIHRYPQGISIFPKLINHDVLELLKESHVVLLPTYAETYGYIVLEAQAAGCSVITTNIRALPEINNEDCGWLIKVPIEENGYGIIGTLKDRSVFSSIVEDTLYEIISDICNNPKLIEYKGAAALNRIKVEHDINNYVKVLDNIYHECHKSKLM